jgi:hypothetical protein
LSKCKVGQYGETLTGKKKKRKKKKKISGANAEKSWTAV